MIIQNQFKKYSIEKQEKQIKLLSHQIEETYNSSWEVDSIKAIGSYALSNGYIINVKDASQNVIWDARIHDGHQCDMVKEDIRLRMFQLNPNWNGDFVTKTFSILNNNEEIGTLEIEYFNHFYSEDDVVFLNTLNTLYLISSIVFILVAIAISSYMSRTISKPIEEVVKASENLSKGIFDKIEQPKSNLKEINTLTQSINSLSNELMNQEIIRKQLTSDVTHELRTPLTTLQTHIEAMIDGVLEPGVVELKSIHEEIIRLSKIVSDLDKVSKYDNNSMILNKEKVNLADLIKKDMMLFNSEYFKKNVTLTSQLKDLEVYIDKDKISQVIINLLSNALKYSSSQGEVKVVVEDLSEVVMITVSDQGMGISEQDLPYIFERFYRVDKSRTRETGGSGIGLTIVKSIILAHKGKIEAKSELGKGTEIIIYLPK